MATAQRTLALAAASGEVVLHALANLRLGRASQFQGNYRQAITCFGQAIAFFDGAPRRERFGQNFLPAVPSRACLAAWGGGLLALRQGTLRRALALLEQAGRLEEA
jgi:hypothetical protein